MGRAVQWRRVNDGSVCRARNHYYYNKESTLDISFFVREGVKNRSTIRYPKLMIVGTKNNKIDRHKVIESIYCKSTYQAKDIVDHLITLAWMIERNGIPADSVMEWIKMQMKLIDTKLSIEGNPVDINTGYPSSYYITKF